MSTNLRIVHIAAMGGGCKSFPFPSGNPPTARQVIADFYGVHPDEVNAKLSERAFRIVGRRQITAESLDSQLVDRDTITVYSKEIAAHGIKGRYVVARPNNLPGVKTVEMCYREHHPLPHLHVNRHQASLNLDGQLLAGSLHSGNLNGLSNWIERHRSDLLENWQRSRAGEPLNQIID